MPEHDKSTREQQGCTECWPESADAAWEFRPQLVAEADLVDESHFYVTIRRCPRCSQRFMSVFAELIDWVAGEDPQYWSQIALTQAEAEYLVGFGIVDDTLRSVGPGRRCLRHDHPKSEPARSYWVTGLRIGPHD